MIKSEFALLQTLSRLFQLVQFVKCWQIFLDLNSKRLYQSSGKEKESRCLVFTSSTKRETFSRCSCAATDGRERGAKKRDARAKLLFCQSNLNLLFFCRSRYRRRRRCLSFLFFLPIITLFSTIHLL